MELKESPDKGIFIKDICINIVKSVQDMERYMKIGADNRYISLINFEFCWSNSYEQR